MVLLHAKPVSKPSVELMLVAIGTHANNGGAEIAMLHLVADPGPLDGPTGCMSPGENGQIWTMSW